MARHRGLFTWKWEKFKRKSGLARGLVAKSFREDGLARGFVKKSFRKSGPVRGLVRKSLRYCGAAGGLVRESLIKSGLARGSGKLQEDWSVIRGSTALQHITMGFQDFSDSFMSSDFHI